MTNKFTKTILIWAVCLLASFAGAGTAKAQSQQLQVDFGSDPLFPNVENFAPGDSVSNTMTVANLTDEPSQIGLELLDNTDCSQDCLAEKLYLKVKSNGSVLLNDPLTSLYEAGQVSLEEIGAGSEVDYELMVFFERGAGDNYQDTSAGFDLRVGIFGEEAVSEEVSSGGDSNSQTGTSGGDSSFLSTQNLRISDIQVSLISSSRAQISWQTNKQASSRVIYSPESHLPSLNPEDPPNYGYSYSTQEFDSPVSSHGVILHSVVLKDLIPDTTYYYRCVSHASPPTIARRGQFTTPEQDLNKEVKGDKEVAREDEGGKTSDGSAEIDPDPSPQQQVKADKEIPVQDDLVITPADPSLEKKQARTDRATGEETAQDGDDPSSREAEPGGGSVAAAESEGGLLVGWARNLWWLWLVIAAALLLWLFLVYKRRKKRRAGESE